MKKKQRIWDADISLYTGRRQVAKRTGLLINADSLDISKFSTHRVEILQYLNYFLNLYFPFPWPDTGSIISACTKLERCFEAPDDHCFHQIIIACKRRFIIYNLCKKTATFLHVFQSKTCFCLGIISHSFISKELLLKHVKDSKCVNAWKKAFTHSESNNPSLFFKRYWHIKFQLLFPDPVLFPTLQFHNM